MEKRHLCHVNGYGAKQVSTCLDFRRDRNRKNKQLTNAREIRNHDYVVNSFQLNKIKRQQAVTTKNQKADFDKLEAILGNLILGTRPISALKIPPDNTAGLTSAAKDQP